MASYEEHRKAAPKSVKVSVIVVSTSKYEKASRGEVVDDVSGAKATALILERGYHLLSRKLVSDEVEMIRLELLRSLYDEGADVVILTGGSGLAKKDVTVEAVKPLVEKEIEGFGELFRVASYQKIGAPSFLTRALAGTISGKLVFCLPGSPQAVEMALGVLLPELSHAVYHAGV